MKNLISAVLAFSLLGTAAASAQPWHGNGGFNRGYHDSYRRDYRGHDNTGAAIGVGLGIFALAAILSSQQQRDDRYQPAYDSRYDGYYGR